MIPRAGTEAETTPSPTGTRGRRHLRLSARQTLWAYVFLLVPLVFYLYIRIWPAFQALNLSLHDWNIVETAKPFVGLENFRRLLNDPRFGRSLVNTLQYTFFGVPTQLALGLVIALLLDRIVRARGLFRAVYFLPYVTPIVAAAWVWQWLYSPNFGPINSGLIALGIPPQQFLNDPSQALLSITAMVVWQYLGFQVVLFLAGLQSIPREFYEAARIDGAGSWAIFSRITLPLLNPTIVFSVVISTIQYLQLFTQVVNMTFTDQGGPVGSTLSVVLYIYQAAFQRFDMGWAAAATVVLFAIVLAITLVQLRVLSRRVEY